MDEHSARSYKMSLPIPYEAGLHPVPNPEEDKQVYRGPQYPGDTLDTVTAQASAEKRWFGMRRSTVILSSVVFVLLAGIVTIGGLFGSKIRTLENRLPPTA